MTLDDGYYVDSLPGPVYSGYARDARAVHFAQHRHIYLFNDNYNFAILASGVN